jgi:hypothetical protein
MYKKWCHEIGTDRLTLNKVPYHEEYPHKKGDH